MRDGDREISVYRSMDVGIVGRGGEERGRVGPQVSFWREVEESRENGGQRGIGSERVGRGGLEGICVGYLCTQESGRESKGGWVFLTTNAPAPEE